MRNRGTLRPSQSGSALIPAGGKLGVTSVPLFSGSLRDPAWDTKGFGPSFPMTKLWRAEPAASVEAGSPWADSQYSRNALMIFGNDSPRQDYCGNRALQWSDIARGFLAMRTDLAHFPRPQGRAIEGEPRQALWWGRGG